MTTYAAADAERSALFGRDGELARLRTWFDRAVDGRASRVLVVGPGGVGKSALLDAFAARVPTAVVVRAEADGDPRQGAFLGLLYAALGVVDLPSHGADEAAAHLLALLGARQDDGPVLLLLHDVHEIDGVSARVLARTLRRLRHDRVLVAASARPEGLATPLGRLFDDGPDAAVWTLPGLDEHGVRDLAVHLRPGRWSRAAIARLHEDTGGHPLYLTTLLRELPEEMLRGDTPLPAPRPLAEEVAAVTARLSDGAYRLLAHLAVLDRPAPWNLLARLEELASVGLHAAARELARAGLVDGVGLGARPELRVHHPLVRSAVYATLDPARRSLMHLAVATAVGGAAGLTHRVAAADGRPDPGLADELEAAARAEPADGRTAADRLLAAADLSATGAEAQRRTLAACLLLVDTQDVDRIESLAPAVRAAQPCPERDVALSFLLDQGLDPAAEVYLQNALDTTGADEEVRALAGVRLALARIFRGRGADADAAAVRAAALTRRPLRAEQALILRAIGRGMDAGPSAGLELLDGRIDGALGADPAITAGTLYLAAGHVVEARTRLVEGLTRARYGAASTSTHRAHCHLVEVLYRTGRWDLAQAEAEVALDAFADGDLPRAEALAHAAAALVPAARGQEARAERSLAAARASLARTFNPQGAHAVAVAEAVLARALGDGARMERALRGLPRAGGRARMLSAPFAPWRPLHVEALIETGDLDAARAVLQCWPRAGEPLWFRLARHRLRALLHLADGRPRRAESALRAGIAAADHRRAEVADECPVDLAELRVLLAGLPHVDDAAEQLASAHPVLAGVAAESWLERIDRIRAATEAAPAPSGGKGLTPRERQVADLVARGMTNREAAEALWVTPKAVDYHLGNVFTKLGIASRRELRGRSFS